MRVAILGGFTTRDIRNSLELFLLNYGIKPTIWESEYDQWYEEGTFPSEELNSFHPDHVWVCTGLQNIRDRPCISDSRERIAEKLDEELSRVQAVLSNLTCLYDCHVLVNNLVLPSWRLLGNSDGTDYRGFTNFVRRFNGRLADWVEEQSDVHIVDAEWISSVVGLDRWESPGAWYLYKCAVAPQSAPFLAFEAAKVMKSLLGKNRKVLDLDLDDTLWGGIIGDDGPENIEVGYETPRAEAFAAFQEYLVAQKDIGVLLAVNSKNDREVALKGLSRADAPLSVADLSDFVANWEPKSHNLRETAARLALLPDSFVFVDDNPRERAEVEGAVPGVACPEIGPVEDSIRILDRSGFFEITSLSEDDANRSKMYLDNALRNQSRAQFKSYEDYLQSLAMEAEIADFAPQWYERIAQLTNKSNQFNLTTLRMTRADVAKAAQSSSCITLYGRLRDRFGDSGLVSVIVGHIPAGESQVLEIDEWLMSCRVLRKGMEFAMADALETRCRDLGIKLLRGTFLPTKKNSMVRDLYERLGYSKRSETPEGATTWELTISRRTSPRQSAIAVTYGWLTKAQENRMATKGLEGMCDL